MKHKLVPPDFNVPEVYFSWLKDGEVTPQTQTFDKTHSKLKKWFDGAFKNTTFFKNWAGSISNLTGEQLKNDLEEIML